MGFTLRSGRTSEALPKCAEADVAEKPKVQRREWIAADKVVVDAVKVVRLAVIKCDVYRQKVNALVPL